MLAWCAGDEGKEIEQGMMEKFKPSKKNISKIKKLNERSKKKFTQKFRSALFISFCCDYCITQSIEYHKTTLSSVDNYKNLFIDTALNGAVQQNLITQK